MAEGGGLLNRYTLQRRIEGSNPSGSASLEDMTIRALDFGARRRALDKLSRRIPLGKFSNSFVDEFVGRSRFYDS